MSQLILIDFRSRRFSNTLVFIYSLFLYLPSTALLPATTYYFISLAVLLYRVFIGGFNREFFYIAAFLMISLMISLLSIFFVDHGLNYYNNFIPLQLSLLCSLIIATSITKRVAYYVILLVLLECIVGYVQILLGVKTFFPFVSVSLPEMGDSHGLLYYMRVYGFTDNSSSFAANVMIMITLFSLYFFDQSKKIKLLVFTLAFLALIVSFSRSGLLAYALLSLIVFAKDFRFRYLKFLLPLLSSLLISSYFLIDWDGVFSQLSRGRENVDLSGRDLIWHNYFQEIIENPILGNHGLRNFLSIPDYGLMHAHNSYIMLLYVLGVLPLFFMILPVLFLLLKKIRISIFLVAMLTYSFAQYFLFWGASLADVVFFSVLVARDLKIKSSQHDEFS